MLKEDKTDIRVARHKVTQEDFTPDSVVNDMLNNFPEEAYRDFDKKMLDPSCGNGNFLIAILSRRLMNCSSVDDAYHALSTIYGVELMADNVEECRTRLYNRVLEAYPTIKDDPKVDYEFRRVLKINIEWHDSLKYDYSFSRALCHYDPKNKKTNIEFKEKDKSAGQGKYPMWSPEQERRQLSLWEN